MNTQTIEQLVFECGLQTPVVIVPAIFLLVLCAWMLFRERHNLGGLWGTAFWCLRAIALGVLVWMFLQPARVTETKTTLPQSVAVIVDRTGSMKTVDPEGEGHAVSWQLASMSSDQVDTGSVQVSLDSAIVALDIAQSRWSQAQNQLQERRETELLRDRFDEVVFALNRANVQLSEKFCQLKTNPRDQKRATELGFQCSELAEFLTDLDLQELDTKAAKLTQRSQENLQALSDTNRQVKTWARSVSETIVQALGSPDPIDRQSQVMQLLTQTEMQAEKQTAADPSDTNLDIKRFTFDEHLTPVLSTDGWPVVEKESGLDSNGVEEATFEIDQVEQAKKYSTTNLTAAIQQVAQLAASQSIRSVVFLTDGGHNTPGSVSPVELVGQRTDLSINFVPIGSLHRLRDVKLYHVDHPRSVIRGDKIVIDALISANGFDGETLKLQLKADEKLIEEKALSIDSEQLDLRHSFTVPATQPGSIEFELTIEPIQGESSTTNNRAIFQVGVVRDRIRVMLADRISRWEYRYLDQLFFRDEHLEHESILFDPRLRATGELMREAAMPKTVERWSDYDVALIGDVTPDELPIESQESLVEFVKEKGGIAILVAGRGGMPHSFEGQPLEQLLPVEKSDDPLSEENYTVGVNRLATNQESVRLDESKPKSELLWQQVFQEQPITWLSEYANPRPTARRLLDVVPIGPDGKLIELEDDSSTPAWVCWQQSGAGRVVFLSAPDTYRLRYRRGDRLHHRFWAQLLRWITSDDPGSDNGRIQLSTDKVQYKPDEAVEITVLLTGEDGEPGPDAVLEAVLSGGSGDGDEQVYTLSADETQSGRYIGKVEGLAPGSYRVGLRGEEIEKLSGDEEVETFINVVTSPDVERVNTTCNRPLMKQIAQATGGQVIPPTALAEWLTLQTGVPEKFSQIERRPIWNRWSCLWIALGCLATEWVVRRVKGLT